MERTVASITTSYNGIEVLPQHIDALLAQSRPLQEIVVIDNGSMDGTSAMLADKYPEVTILRLPQNLGAAGGWAAGLAYAVQQKRYDWVWNFDDDSVPAKDALDLLLSGIEELDDDPKVGMLVPLPVHMETGIVYPPMLWHDGFVKPKGELLRKRVWFADLAVASGCLVRCEIVKTIGLPRSDFFMDFFDFEYCLRARSNGFLIAVVSACKFSHEIGKARHVRLPGVNRLWSNYSSWREYYIARNAVYAIWHLFPTQRAKRFISIHLLRRAVRISLFGRNKIETLKRMFQGFQDGLHGKLGIRFQP